MEAERVLRLAVERLLDEAARPPAPTVRRVAAALVAAGTLDPATAASIVADAGLAWGIRSAGRLSAADLRDRPAAPGATAWSRPDPRWVAVSQDRSGPLPRRVVAGGAGGTTVTSILPGPTVPGPARARAGHHGGVRPAMRRPARPGPLRDPDPGAAAPGDAARVVVRTPTGASHRLREPSGRAGGLVVAALEPGIDGVPEWLEVATPDGPVSRLAVTRPGPAVGGRPHGRTPGASWLLGALLADAATAADGHDVGPLLGPAVAALVEVGALTRADPLARQAVALDAVRRGEGRAEDLEPSLASVVGRRPRPDGADRAVAVATLVDLGSAAARLDALVDDASGTWLLGRCSPWWPAAEHGWVLSGFDDRDGHHAGRIHAAVADGTGADVAWRLTPRLDPDAHLLRLTLASGPAEAAVEVNLT